MKRRLARGFTLIELMIVVAIIGILAAIAVPNFMKFQARARQSEAKANLKGFFTSVKAYFAEQGTYVCGTCGFSPEKKNRYQYDLSATDSIASDPAGSCTKAANPDPAQTSGGFTATAIGNIDSDTSCDEWSINDGNDLKNNQNDVDVD